MTMLEKTEVEPSILKACLNDFNLAQKLSFQMKDQDPDWENKEVLFLLLEFSLRLRLEDGGVVQIIQVLSRIFMKRNFKYS